MKITASIYNFETLKNTAELIDSAVLMIPKYSLIHEEEFDLDKAIEFCNKNNIDPIISLNRIFLEDELDDVREFISRYKSNKFLVHDLGVIQIMKELKVLSNVIYEASTMVCNSLDLEIYSGLGFDAVSMSNEIPIIDVIESYNKTKANIFYQVFGLKSMFYSKRRLLTLFELHSNQNFDRHSLCIKEEKREELMPIEECKNGYVVFRSYNLSLLDEMQNLNFIKYAYFETLRLKSPQILNILHIYKDYINGKHSLEHAHKKLDELNLNTKFGFEYSDSIHVKEKIINE